MTDEERKDNVIDFPGYTYNDLPVDKVLDSAKQILEGGSVTVLGMTKDGFEYYASSTSDSARMLWLLERLKWAIMHTASEDEDD